MSRFRFPCNSRTLEGDESLREECPDTIRRPYGKYVDRRGNYGEDSWRSYHRDVLQETGNEMLRGPGGREKTIRDSGLPRRTDKGKRQWSESMVFVNKKKKNGQLISTIEENTLHFTCWPVTRLFVLVFPFLWVPCNCLLFFVEYLDGCPGSAPGVLSPVCVRPSPLARCIRRLGYR